MKQTLTQSRAARKKRMRYISVGVAVIAIISIGVILIHRHSTSLSPANKTATSTPSTNLATSSASGSSNPTPNPNVPGGSTGKTSTSQPSLITPSGTFVSNHSTDLDPNNSRDQEQSICNTTAGATCEITFTKDGVTKSLGPQTAVASKSSVAGTASWPVWSPLSLGLTSGTWLVQATTTLNGQTKTANDTLTVQ